jgi:hypothetical protein
LSHWRWWWTLGDYWIGTWSPIKQPKHGKNDEHQTKGRQASLIHSSYNHIATAAMRPELSISCQRVGPATWPDCGMYDLEMENFRDVDISTPRRLPPCFNEPNSDLEQDLRFTFTKDNPAV